MTALKAPVGLASLMAEIGRHPNVNWVKVVRADEWKWVRPDAGDPKGPDSVTRQTNALLVICTTQTSGEEDVADLTLEDSPDTTGGAVVTAVDLHERQEYRHVAIVVGAIGRDLVG